MLTPVFKTQLNRDVKKAKKQGKDLQKFKEIVSQLVKQEPLALHHRDHALTGNFRGCRECHIEPDWLLIYKIEQDQITFVRLGSHSELFR